MTTARNGCGTSITRTGNCIQETREWSPWISMPGENQLQNLLPFRSRLPGRQTMILVEIRGFNDERWESVHSCLLQSKVKCSCPCSISGDSQNHLTPVYRFRFESMVMRQRSEMVFYPSMFTITGLQANERNRICYSKYRNSSMRLPSSEIHRKVVVSLITGNAHPPYVSSTVPTSHLSQKVNINSTRSKILFLVL